MKPRISLEETQLPDGSLLTLQEHDGRHYLLAGAVQICGPATRAAEEELARLACAPFRPARQPRIWLIGLGLGNTLAAVQKELLQKRGHFTVAEPIEELPQWLRKHLPETPLDDPRVRIENDPGPIALRANAGELHAILIHLDASPMDKRNRPWVEDKRWVAAAFEALQPGGLLAIAGSRESRDLTRKLQGSGFEVAEYTVPSSALAKRPRMQPIWLARKP